MEFWLSKLEAETGHFKCMWQVRGGGSRVCFRFPATVTEYEQDAEMELAPFRLMQKGPELLRTYVSFFEHRKP